MLLCAGIAAAADWPGFRGGADRAGHYPGTIVSLDSIQTLWIDSLGGEIISSPSVVNNMLYIGCRDNRLRAINAATGKVRWQFIASGWIDASPAVHANQVVVGSRDGNLYVLDTATGSLRKKIAAGMQLSSPAFMGGTTLVGTGAPYGGLCGIDSETQSSAPAWTIPFPQLCYSSPAVLGRRAFIGANDGYLYACNIVDDRGIQWQYFTGNNAYMASPALADSAVYFASGGFGATVCALSAATGTPLWKTAIVSMNRAAAFSASAQSVSAPLFKQIISLPPDARDRAIGRLGILGIKFPLASTPKPPGALEKRVAPTDSFFSYGEIRISSVAIDKQRVYLCMRELGYPKPLFSLVALDKKTGSEIWRFSRLIGHVPIGYCSSPVVTDSFVFAGAGEGKLFAFSSRDGKKLWEYSLGGGDIISSPALAMGALFVATRTGRIYAYSLNEHFPRIIVGTFKDSTYCFPNPARRGVSHIKIFLAKPGTVEMVLFNSDEKPIAVSRQTLSAGDYYTYDWSTARVANGVYFARISARYEDGKKEQKILKVAVLN